jgi:hypothetical protein
MQRPQQLALQLAEAGYKVIWVNPDLGQASSRHHNIQRINKNLLILELKGICYANFYTSSLSKKDANLIVNAINKLLPNVELSDRTALFQSPFWHTMDSHQFNQSVYDCMDAHEAFGSATLEVSAIEDQMFKKATKITTSSSYLKDKIKKEFGRDAVIIRNACNPKDFEPTPSPHSKKNPTVGYFGAVAEWFDFDLLIQVAHRLPNHDFVIIGNTAHSNLEKKTLPSNIFMKGEVPYNKLPEIASSWDVAIIPFLLTELIQATNPVKLYEYYALGLPVVATSIPEVMECPVKAYTATTDREFAEKIKSAIKENLAEKRSERQIFAQSQTWKHRATDFIQCLESAQC